MIKQNKKYKDFSCVYCILNTVNGKRYIGQTKCLYRRSYQYAKAMKVLDEIHLNTHFRNAVSKYGAESFEMFPIEACKPEELYEREAYWINFYGTLNRENGYNLRMDVGGRMVTHPETSAKISSNLKSQWESGVRDGHSEKLKQSWLSRDRGAQSKLFSEALTKWYYKLQPDDPDYEMFIADYQDLVDIGLKSVFSAFHKAKDKSGWIKTKGYWIQRVSKAELEAEYEASLSKELIVDF